MTKDRQIDKLVSNIKSGVPGQAVGFLLWPLLTVILVVGALYYERVHDLEETVARKEMLVLKTTGQLLRSASTSVALDMLALAESESLTGYLSEADSASFSTLSGLLDEIVNNNSAYARIRLLGPDGNILISVPEQGETAALPRAGPGAEQEYNVKAAILDQPDSTIYCFPSAIDVSVGDPDNPSVPILRFATILQEQQNRRGAILVFDYLLSGLLEAIEVIERREAIQLFLLNPRNYVQGSLEMNTFPSVISNAVSDSDKSSAGSHVILPDMETMRRQKELPFFHNGNLYSFISFDLFSESYRAVNRHLADSNKPNSMALSGHQWLLVSRIPASYFSAYKRSYIQFLLVLAAALLVPSIVVCIFLAKTKFRVYQEATSRYRQQVVHLAELEDKVKQRTREVDDRNLQLSAEIAERLAAENKLKQSNELLSGMLQSLDGIIYVADFDNHEILFANDYLKNLFGFDPVGKKCWQFIHSSKDGPCEFCTNNKLIDRLGEPTGPYQWEYQNPFNKKWYAAKDQAIRWSNGKFVKLEIAIDITEQKRLQHFLSEARRQAELAKGIRSRFVALVAHDLKSPFFSITQMLKRILERETFTHRVHRQFLENIVENGHRMLLMIDNLLSMDRFESAGVKLEKTFFDVSEMVQEVLQNFNHLASEKEVRLTNNIPDCSWLYADKYLYFVVLNNLLSNAIKFSEPGGTIELFIPDQARSMTVVVKDNGKGMSAEYAINLFKEDVKTSSRGTGGEKGSGLGLIFCQDILKAHHGIIKVESEPGVGTTFRIELPEVCRIGDTNQPAGGSETQTIPIGQIQAESEDDSLV